MSVIVDWPIVVNILIASGSLIGGAIGGYVYKNGNGKPRYKLNGNGRTKLMSEETKEEFKEIWDKTRSKDVCISIHDGIKIRLTNIESDVGELRDDFRQVKDDIKIILSKI